MENFADPRVGAQALGSAEILQRAFQYAVPGFAIFSLEGQVLDCNPSFSQMVGRTLQELRALEPNALVHPEDRARAQHDRARLIKGESPAFVIEKRYVRPDASIVWVRNSISLLYGPDNTPLHVIAISEDMTLFRLAERALVKNEKLATVGRLSASIAHELNNPLESVMNLLYLIAHGNDLAQIHEFAAQADEEMRRVVQISTQTLRFYRPQSSPGPLQLTEVVDSVLTLFEGRLRGSNVQLVKRLVPSNDLPVAYSSELRQVFINLIGNALDAMEGRGLLRIDVRPSHAWTSASPVGVPGVRVTICDSGSGIPRHLLKKVFEPFVSTKEDHGTGLGLWISRDIIHRHGGILNVRSSTHGARRGTAMSVFLPVPSAAAATIAA